MFVRGSTLRDSSGNYITSRRLNLEVGFAAIGTGGRHAELTLIQNEFRPTVNLSEAVFLTYLAKKNAEHAPGVGKKLIWY